MKLEIFGYTYMVDWAHVYEERHLLIKMALLLEETARQITQVQQYVVFAQSRLAKIKLHMTY